MQCWLCKFWEASYEVRVRGEIEIIRGKCPNKKGIVNDSDKVCDKFESIGGKNGNSINNTSQ